jgi:hypothetical protein
MAGELFKGFKAQRYTYGARLSLANNIKIQTSGLDVSTIISRFQGAVDRASTLIASDLRDALGAALRSSVWETPSGRADIVDTGQLLASGSVTVSQSGVTIAYDAPYAALVHFGGYINVYGNPAAKVYLPPRPWVESVLRGGGPVPRFDFESYYRAEITKAFR